MFGEKLVLKMWESLADNGIGSLAAPWQIKRKGRAHIDVRREEILVLAQAESDASDIKNGKKQLLPDGSLVSLTEPELEIILHEPEVDIFQIQNKVETRKKATDILQEISLNKTILLAEEELLRSKQETPEESIDSDWVFRWQEHAKKVQSDELREIWARILAGEVKAPGSYSLRTLDFIKNLSKKEALSISKLGQFVIENKIFKCDRLDQAGIDFPFLLQMEDLGILSGVEGGDVAGLELMICAKKVGKIVSHLINRNLALLIESNDLSQVLKLKCYRLSRIGAEVLSLGDFQADREYMLEVGQKIKYQNFNVKISSYIPKNRYQGNFINPKRL